MDSAPNSPLRAPPPSPYFYDPSHDPERTISTKGVYFTSLGPSRFNKSHEKEETEHERERGSRDNLSASAHEGFTDTSRSSAGPAHRKDEDGAGTHGGLVQETKMCPSSRPWVNSLQTHKDHPAKKRRLN
jgi:hypothetical protein